MLEQGLLVVISGPSGAGKGTVIKEILDHNDDICLSVSCTTRPPRPGETDGVHYYFKTRQEFKSMLRNGEFLEFATVFDNYYGTPIFAVDEKRRQGKDVVLEIDVQGALEVRRKVADALLIFIHAAQHGGAGAPAYRAPDRDRGADQKAVYHGLLRNEV